MAMSNHLVDKPTKNILFQGLQMAGFSNINLYNGSKTK